MTSLSAMPGASVSDERAVALLEDIVRIESPTGRERAVARALVGAMNELGLRARLDEVGNAVGERTGKPAVVGAPKCDIVLLGHMDTFPGVVPVRREGDNLYGRGSVDAKGPLAAFVIATARVSLPPGVRVVVIGAIDEEGPDSVGARHAARCYMPSACIIGEPSRWNGVTIGYKGRVLVTFRARRACAHSAGRGRSAPDAAVAWWAGVQRHLDAMSAGRGRVFDRVQHTLRSIRSDSDGIHEWCEARAGFRIPPGLRPEDIVEICRTCAADIAGTDPEPGAMHTAVSSEGAEVPVVSDRNAPPVRALASAIREVSGGRERVQVKTGTCDMNVVAPIWKCPIAAYGPGDSALDHTPDEHVSITEYLNSIRVLTRAIERLGAELAGT